MLQMCVSTASYDGTFQHALLAILTLLEGSRLWQGASMSQDLGTATVNFWLQDRLKIIFEVRHFHCTNSTIVYMLTVCCLGCVDGMSGFLARQVRPIYFLSAGHLDLSLLVVITDSWLSSQSISQPRLQ